MARKQRKARNRILTESYLKGREEGCKGAGYSTPKWIVFSRVMLRRGFVVSLYEAKFTVSKYLTVSKDGVYFRLRFSDHKPIPEKEANGDCDFFVGHTNFGKTNTNDALKAVLLHFGEVNPLVEKAPDLIIVDELANFSEEEMAKITKLLPFEVDGQPVKKNGVTIWRKSEI